MGRSCLEGNVVDVGALMRVGWVSVSLNLQGDMERPRRYHAPFHLCCGIRSNFSH